MKKIITVLVLALGFATTTQAQKNQKDQFTVAQKTELKVKKMILHLDLTNSQVKKITPLVKKQIENREIMREKRRSAKENNKKLTADERYEMANKNLDEKIATKKRMKQILSEEQFKKFEKMANHKGKKGKKGKKGGKGKKDRECNKNSSSQKE